MQPALQTLLAVGLLLYAPARTLAQLTAIYPALFTPAECDDLVAKFSTMERTEDKRVNPLLPQMGGDSFRVARANRFDDGSLTDFVEALVLDRLVAQLNGTASHELRRWFPHGSLESGAAFSRLVDFSLLHEFDGSLSMFDWHVDTKPNDSTRRTLNLNVMLTNHDGFRGGGLRIGDERILPLQVGAHVTSFLPCSLAHLLACSHT